jgi:3-(3-hydroxy-phenyl)propionate hydroxylase
MKPELLASYHDERHAHAKAMIELADLFGAVLSQRNRFVAWMRDRFFLAIKDVPRVRDYLLQMKFKPMPRFTRGIVQDSGDARRDGAVGRMFIQPNVERERGGVQRLDDVVGPRFALIGWRCDPLACAPADLRERLKQLGCDSYVAVRARGVPTEAGSRVPAVPSGDVLEDSENVLQPWFRAHDADWVLIRPDRFVAAVGREGAAVAQLTAFCDAVLRGESQASRVLTQLEQAVYQQRKACGGGVHVP